MNDQLPTVSWIICTSTQSEHPSYRPGDGAAFVASKIDAIAANPEVWAKTVVHPQLRRERRPLRPRRRRRPRRRARRASSCTGPPRAAPGQRAAGRGGLPGARDRRLAVDGGRLGVLRAVRPHVGAAVPGAGHRRAGAEHLGVAAAHVRRPDLGVPVRRRPAAAPRTVLRRPRPRSRRRSTPGPRCPRRLPRGCPTLRRMPGAAADQAAHPPRSRAPGRGSRRTI